MSEDIKQNDNTIDYDCISRSRLVRQITKMDDIMLSPKTLSRIMEVIQNQVPYGEIDYGEIGLK